jgi:acyl-CoA thioesterase FadM
MRGARTVWVQTVSEAATRRPVVTAEVTGAFLTESGKPLRVPPSFRETLAALHVPEELEH